MSDDDDRDDEGSSEEEEDGALPSVLKPFMQGSEEPLLTAKRVANYTEGEACYGIVVGQKVRPIWTIAIYVCIMSRLKRPNFPPGYSFGQQTYSEAPRLTKGDGMGSCRAA
jgi:hypothetical protein